jgi:hypothetical protein
VPVDDIRLQVPFEAVIACSSDHEVTVVINSEAPVTTADLDDHNTDPDAHPPILALIAGKADADHGHEMEDVSGLVAALAARALVDHAHELADVTGLTAALAAKSDTSHGHEMADVSGLAAALAALVPQTRAINTSGALRGGGDLSEDRTLSIVPGTTEQSGTVMLAGPGHAIAGTDATRVMTPVVSRAALEAYLKYDTIYVGGGAMTPSPSDGATPEVIEDVTNWARSVVTFGADADSYASFILPVPDDFDSTVALRARFFWTHSGASVGDVVRLVLKAQPLGTSGDMNSSAVTKEIDDAVAADDGYLHTSPVRTFPSISVAAGDLMRFVIYRDHDYGSPAMAADLQLIGVQIQYAKTGAQSVWS